MNDPANLDMPDDGEWSRICAMQRESLGAKPTVAVRCEKCRKVLARSGAVASGYLWSATWEEDQGSGFAVVRDGKSLLPRDSAKHSGFPRRSALVRAGYFASLIPGRVNGPTVPLYVNCARHGDGVADRNQVLAAVRGGTKADLSVAVTLPREGYTPQRTDGLDVQPVTERFTSTIKADGFDTPEAFDAWWRGQVSQNQES